MNRTEIIDVLEKCVRTMYCAEDCHMTGREFLSILLTRVTKQCNLKNIMMMVEKAILSLAMILALKQLHGCPCRNRIMRNRMNEILICIAVAVAVIAVCEVIRAAQNFAQIEMMRHDTGARDNAYAEFVKSLKADDREYVKRLLEEFEEGQDEIHN